MECDDLPKGSQQPVIDYFEESSHCVCSEVMEGSWVLWLWLLWLDLCYPVVAVWQRTLVDFVAGGKAKQAGGGDFALIVVVRIVRIQPRVK